MLKIIFIIALIPVIWSGIKVTIGATAAFNHMRVSNLEVIEIRKLSIWWKIENVIETLLYWFFVVYSMVKIL